MVSAYSLSCPSVQLRNDLAGLTSVVRRLLVRPYTPDSRTGKVHQPLPTEAHHQLSTLKSRWSQHYRSVSPHLLTTSGIPIVVSNVHSYQNHHSSISNQQLLLELTSINDHPCSRVWIRSLAHHRAESRLESSSLPRIDSIRPSSELRVFERATRFASIY